MKPAPDLLAEIDKQVISDLLKLNKKIIVGWNERRTLLLLFKILLMRLRPNAEFRQSCRKIMVLIDSSLTYAFTKDQREEDLAK